MQVIRMVKLFGWEPQIANRIHDKREDELNSLLKTEMSEIVVNILKFVEIYLAFFSFSKLTGISVSCCQFAPWLSPLPHM